MTRNTEDNDKAAQLKKRSQNSDSMDNYHHVPADRFDGPEPFCSALRRRAMNRAVEAIGRDRERGFGVALELIQRVLTEREIREIADADKPSEFDHIVCPYSLSPETVENLMDGAEEFIELQDQPHIRTPDPKTHNGV